MNVPIHRLIYPFKTAWDRGTTEQVPARWHGVNFYYILSSEGGPEPIYNVAPLLKTRLAAFLEEAHRRFHVVGINHIGVYQDRPVSNLTTASSSHAFGQAFDITGFQFSDGSVAKVKNRANLHIATRLQPIVALLRQHFDVVSDWCADPKRHGDHLHAEVEGFRSLSESVFIRICVFCSGRAVHWWERV